MPPHTTAGVSASPTTCAKALTGGGAAEAIGAAELNEALRATSDDASGYFTPRFERLNAATGLSVSPAPEENAGHRPLFGCWEKV